VGGKLVEPTPEIERELTTELEKVAKQYGGGEGVDMTQFPTFKFKGKYTGEFKTLHYLQQK
jgi:F-type H+-transporting ATPase subunit 6